MGILGAAIRQLRPKQWAKNVFLFPALIFSGEFTNPEKVGYAVAGFVAFSLLASAGYIFNDYVDREADRNHPKKKHRPIASGALPLWAAWLLLALCLVGGGALAWWVSPGFLVVAVVYLTTTLSYSFYFKHIVILDVLFLSSGFLWRVIAGAKAVDVEVSSWLFLCTVFVALFFGFNKRRGELVKMGGDAGTRKNLAEYTPAMLEQYQAIVTSSLVITYILYAVRGPTRWMVLTIPFVLYGVFRYIYLIERHGEGGAPDETLFEDRPILLTGLGYAATVVFVLVGTEAGWLPALGLLDGND
ncbi:MAG: decaprenyl-phosphate phosphoribosyltransferase [Myxococcota bacterium]